MDRQQVSREKEFVKYAVKNLQTILLVGAPSTGIKRVVDSVIELYCESEGERKSVINNSHADFRFADGRELKVDEARELRSLATTNPSRWPRRFMAISYLDRPHYTVLPVLLKLIEEPPQHFAAVLSVGDLKGIPQTIPSRSVIIKISLPSRQEVEDELALLGVSEPAWRAAVCGGDLDTALGLDFALTRNWHKLWSSACAGSSLGVNFPSLWRDELEEANEDTKTACWEIVIEIASRKAWKSNYWREIALKAMSMRDLLRQGRANEIQQIEALVQCYALVETSAKREK